MSHAEVIKICTQIRGLYAPRCLDVPPPASLALQLLVTQGLPGLVLIVGSMWPARQ